MKRYLQIGNRLLLLGVFVTPITLTGCVVECEDGYCYGGTYGYYYDSLVSGLTYRIQNAEGITTSTGVTGEENDPGRFRYDSGDTVSFSLGATDLGQSLAQERMTPFDVAGVTEDAVGGCDVDEALPGDESAFRIVHNLAVLLQTLDTDGDHTTGIEISAEVVALFANATIEMDQPWGTFQADNALIGVIDAANGQNLFANTRTLRQREEALRNLYQGIGQCPSES